MKKSQAKTIVIESVLEPERDDFHREWAPEQLKGLSLQDAYQKAINHIFMVAVVATYGMERIQKVSKNQMGGDQSKGENDFNRR